MPGGLGMIAIGVGGADAVDVMTGMEWELKMPKLIGGEADRCVERMGFAKDVILKTGRYSHREEEERMPLLNISEREPASLSATGKATICNMGAGGSYDFCFPLR